MDWELPKGYEISAGAYGVQIANNNDDSSGATTLTYEEAWQFGRALLDASIEAQIAPVKASR